MAIQERNSDRLAASLKQLVVILLAWIFFALPVAAQSFTSFGAPVDRSRILTPGSIPVPSIRPEERSPETVDALIKQMSVAAGVIFAGQVTAVRRPAGFSGSGQDAAEGIVEIDLHVDQSLRGAVAGSIYTLREWAGLWTGGAERYKAGQRFLLFLYPSDAHGVSAPVHGAEGTIPLRGSGVAPGPDDANTSSSDWLVDLRWLEAKTLRRSLYTTLPVHPPVPVDGPVSQAAFAVLPGSSNIDEISSNPPSTEEIDPALVHAIRAPWAAFASSAVVFQPLSKVLAMCQEALRSQALFLNTIRRRDDSQ